MTTSSYNMLREALDQLLAEVELDPGIKKTSMVATVPDFGDSLGISNRSPLKRAYNTVNELLSADANIAPGYALVRAPKGTDPVVFSIVDVKVARAAMWKVYTRLNDGATTGYRMLDVLEKAMEKGVVGSLALYPDTIDVEGKNSRVYVVDSAVLDVRAQGKGLMLKAYTHLVTELGYKLLSDSLQSVGGMKLWQALAKQPGVKVRAWQRGSRTWLPNKCVSAPSTVHDIEVAKRGGFSTPVGPTHVRSPKSCSSPFLRLIATKA